VENALKLTMMAKCAIIVLVGKHEKTLEAMKQLPKSSSLRWADIENRLIHRGACVKEGAGSAISVSLNGEMAFFHRPHPSDKADKGAIENALEFLRRSGVIE
jgi:hypothetical protein